MFSGKLDIQQYGFVLKKEIEGHAIYTCEKDGKEVELSVWDNVYSINIICNDTIIKVANRYRVDTQEQLDFLLLNGRIGIFFAPLSCDNHTV